MNGMLLALVATVAVSGTAHADDLGFRYDEATGRCLRNGVEGHNSAYVGECGDMSRLHLFGRDLRGLDLRGAVLYRAHLSHADLTGADLRGAHLEGAYLHKANLAGTDLRGATFGRRFGGAELSRVELAGARFDESTVLPFSTEVAEARRMILDGSESARR